MMNMLDLYESVVACPEVCADIVRDLDTNIPRGFFTLAKPGTEVRLLLVAQNPGQPMDVERNLYRGLGVKAATKAHIQFVDNCFFRGEGKVFHNRLVDWLTDLLEADARAVFEQVVYTNAVKCTTRGNRVPIPATAELCLRLHLKREIDFWKPRLVVALGAGAHRLLELSAIDHDCLPHPSHRRGREYHRAKLELLRAKMRASAPTPPTQPIARPLGE
jgi:uracil-DNA glycosylase family 4